jgi:hypothetical protein
VKARALKRLLAELDARTDEEWIAADEAAAVLAKGGARRVSLAVIAKSEPSAAYADHWGKS